MDSKPPRSREILGPRPSPLKIRKDSHRFIKKPPLAPSPLHEPSQPPRGPVIMYTVSPKIIHTHPNDFMALVQRLTGKTSTSPSTSSSYPSTSASPELGFVGGVETTEQYHHHQNRAFERPKDGILSPGPTSFGPADPQGLSALFNEFNSILQTNPSTTSSPRRTDQTLISTPKF